MKLVDSIVDWQAIREIINPRESIGFVPTMGFLHSGHASLLHRARKENDYVVLSIFVNPTQFNDPSDYEKYPKNLTADLSLAEEYGVDYLFLPSIEVMYPQGYQFSINTEHPISTIMEGEYRPGHFPGMLTIVMKLLQLIRATRAYFGEKDYQQYVLIEAMVKEFFIPTTIIPCPIIRELSRLPLSSRNSRLSASEKQLANEAFELIYQTPSKNFDHLRNTLETKGIHVDYLTKYANRIFSAIRVGAVRLIDNFKLGEN